MFAPADVKKSWKFTGKDMTKRPDQKPVYNIQTYLPIKFGSCPKTKRASIFRKPSWVSKCLHLYREAKLWPLRLRPVGTRWYEVELRIYACTVVRAVHECHAAHIKLTEVDRLDDLCPAFLDLRGCSIVDDKAL